MGRRGSVCPELRARQRRSACHQFIAEPIVLTNLFPLIIMYFSERIHVHIRRDSSVYPTNPPSELAEVDTDLITSSSARCSPRRTAHHLRLMPSSQTAGNERSLSRVNLDSLQKACS